MLRVKSYVGIISTLSYYIRVAQQLWKKHLSLYMMGALQQK